MPLPALAAAAIPAATSLLSSGMNAYMQARQNKKNRQFSEHMYNRQRQDSIDDWNRQNEYNSPEKQMQRLRDAGLNPNLVYGSGSAANTSAQVRSSSFSQPDMKAPQIDLSGVGQSISNYQDFKMREAQTNNMVETNKILKTEQAIKQMDLVKGSAVIQKLIAETAYTNVKNQSGTFDLNQKQRLADTSFETAQAGLNKILKEIENLTTTKSLISATTQKTLESTRVMREQNKRAAELHPYNVQKAAEQVAIMKLTQAGQSAKIEQINQLMQGETIKQMINKIELDMQKRHTTMKDPYIQRQFQRVNHYITEEIKKLF